MDFANLTNDNVLLYAIRAYDNPSAHGSKEFEEDFERFKYVKRLLKRYVKKGVIKERLVLNHITILYNVFGLASTRILFLKMEPELYPALKTFLIAISFMPDLVTGINGKTIRSSDIMPDPVLVSLIRNSTRAIAA
jgi:hypothetical protein